MTSTDGYWVFVLSVSCFLLGIFAEKVHRDLELAQESKVIEQPMPPSKEECAKLMKYHGTSFCFSDNGVWVFLREGQKCKLEIGSNSDEDNGDRKKHSHDK